MAGTIIVFVILVIINVVLFILALQIKSYADECDASESVFCPTMYCAVSDTDCGKNAYRTDSSNKKICQKYSSQYVAPSLKEPL